MEWATQKGERFCDLRIDQALLKIGAEVLGKSACPYCITMLEDSRITMGVDEKDRGEGYH